MPPSPRGTLRFAGTVALTGRYTMRGHLEHHADVVREYMAIAAATGLFEKGATYETIVQRGQLPFAGLGRDSRVQTATHIEPGKPYYSLRDHVERGEPCAAYAHRAQFYIDDPWYLEAGEALPTFKETPPIGATHPCRLVSGHIRGSIPSMHTSRCRSSCACTGASPCYS